MERVAERDRLLNFVAYLAVPGGPATSWLSIVGHRRQIRLPRFPTRLGVVVSICRVRVFPLAGAGEAVGVEATVAFHPRAPGGAVDVKASLAPRQPHADAPAG